MHNAIANSVYRSIVNRSSEFYYFLGKTKPYQLINGVEQVETPLPTYKYELSTRKDIILMNQITPTDVSFVIPRVDWESGQVFDQYDDFYSSTFPSHSGATSLETSKFYVLTGDYNLYICLDNNNNSISTVLPSGADTIPFITGDGYKWKYIMNIPSALRLKFLTAFYIPITTAINSSFYNNGAISSVIVDDPGTGYTANTTAAITITLGTPTAVTALVTGRTYKIASLGTTTNINWNTLAGTTTALTISSFVGNGTTTVTGNVASTTGFVVGDTIVISGATGTEQTKLNGTWTIASVPSGTSFTFVVTTAVGSGSLTASLGTSTKYKTYIVGSILTPTVVGTGTGTLTGTGAILKPRISSVDGSVFKVDIGLVGSGYPANTTLSITGTGTGASISPTIVNGAINFVQILSPGSGYHVNNTSLSITTDSGSGAQITAIVENNKIVDTIIVNSGSGYRSAKLTAVGATGTGAKFSVICAGGELNTVQANVELLAINGSIDNIYVSNQGSGYSIATVTITGDGNDATATAVIDSGKIVKINITNSGTDYTYATVTITAAVSIPTVLASARAIISPYYGHGKDVMRQLFANTLMFYSEISNSNANGFTFNNDYRQFGIIKQPNSYGLQSSLQDSFGYACYVVEGVVTNGTIVDDLVLVDTAGNEFVVVTSVTLSSSPSTVVRSLLQPITNGALIYGQVLSSGSLSYSVSSVTNPIVDKYSGDLLYINNKTSFFQTDSQSVTLQTVLKF